MPLYFHAMYPFEGDVSQDQLRFPAGAVLTVTDPARMNQNGWNLGEYQGKMGWFPVCYVQEILPPVNSTSSSSTQVRQADHPSRRLATAGLPWEEEQDEQRQDDASGFDGPPMGGYSEAVARQQAQKQQQEAVTVIDTSPQSKREAAAQAVKKTSKGIRKRLVSASSKTGHLVSSIRNRNRVADDDSQYSKPSVSMSPKQAAS